MIRDRTWLTRAVLVGALLAIGCSGGVRSFPDTSPTTASISPSPSPSPRFTGPYKDDLPSTPSEVAYFGCRDGFAGFIGTKPYGGPPPHPIAFQLTAPGASMTF